MRRPIRSHGSAFADPTREDAHAVALCASRPATQHVGKGCFVCPRYRCEAALASGSFGDGGTSNPTRVGTACANTSDP
jgi:hypothetical protein